jgi:hypothetical protein
LIVASVNTPLPPTSGTAISGALATELSKVGIDSIADINLRRIGSKRSLDTLLTSYPVPANSDYFPFVDLTAARMRFLQRNALSLGELNLRALPVMELLGEPALEAPTTYAAPREAFLRRDYVEQASDSRAALISGEVHDLPMNVAEDVLTVHMSASTCAKAGATATWLQAVKSMAARTTPHLPARDMRQVWQAIRESGCYSMVEGEQRHWLEFLEAAAARDRDGIIIHGKELLALGDSLIPEMRGEVLVVVSAAQLGGGNSSAARELLLQHQALIDSRRDADLGIRLVEALAIASISRSPENAAARPSN